RRSVRIGDRMRRSGSGGRAAKWFASRTTCTSTTSCETLPRKRMKPPMVEVEDPESTRATRARASIRAIPRKPSPAQRAIQLTFVLKGHLKNAQISYLRVAAGLAQIRDQRLFAALKHDCSRPTRR